jgi:RHS repeat-associated protein
MQYGRAAYTFRINKGPDLIDYLYDTKDQRIYKKLDAPGTTLDNEEYYLQDAMGRAIAIKQTNSAGTNWEYYLFGTEREMLLKPKANQAPGANASNTAKRVNLTQATAYLYDHLGNTRVAYMPNTWNTTLNKVTFNIEHVADYSPYGKIIRENVIIDKAKYLTTQHERDAETGLDYRGARYYDSDIARFLSLDPLACKYPSWSAYNYVLSNPMNLIDPTGKEAEDWFLNTQSGRMVYLKGKSEITQADLDKIGSPYSLSDYAWVGGDNIFGENLPVTLPKSNGTNPLEKDYLIVDEVFTELLMDYLGYEKAKQITIKEWEFVSGGRMGSENFSSTTFDMKQLGGEKICFILRDHLDASVNKFNDVKKITDQGRYSTITTVVYNTTIPYKQELPKISYFDEINTGKTLGKALGCVGTILDAYWENKKIKI